jgi:methyl-accepting chemotaxis protein
VGQYLLGLAVAGLLLSGGAHYAADARGGGDRSANCCGDLQVEIPAGKDDEIGRMLEALRMMTTRLSTIIQDQQAAAKQMLEISAHLNDAAQGLSCGNSQQAAGVAQTTVSIEQ